MSARPSSPERDRAFAHAALRNLAELNRALAWSPQTVSFSEDGFFRWRTRVPHRFYSGVVCSTLPDRAAPQRVEEALDDFRRHGPSSFIWWLDAEVPAATWAPFLEPRGFTLDTSIPAMVEEIDALRDVRVADVEVRRIAGAAEREIWAKVFAVGTGFPPEWASLFADLFGGMDAPGEGLYRGYLAFVDGEPVATATVLVTGEVAGLYDVAVLPGMRGRGIGAAMTLVPLRDARDSGCRVAILHASPLGRPVYERLGFRTVCTVDHFVWKPPEAAGR